jgi:DNA invertase Pin-like site-specific DNA recombinase
MPNYKTLSHGRYKLIPYGRVSSEEQRKNTSVGTQIDGITRGALTLLPGCEVLKSFSDVASARSDNRPGLNAAFSYAKWYNQVSHHPATHLGVWVWDRLSRDRDLSAAIRNRFKEIGVEVNAIQEWVNYQDSGEVIVHSVREALAQAESMKNSERTKRGMKQRMREGYWIFDVHKGYKKSEILNANGTRAIIVDKEVARQKNRALSFVAGGMSRKAAWRMCGAREVLGSYNSFCESLLSPFDLGLIDYTFPCGERITTAGHHPAITTKKMQDDARKAINKAMRTLTPSRQTERLARNPARQVLCCPKCGKPLTSSTPKSRGVAHEYYSCYKSTKRGACGSYNLRRQEAHNKLSDLLQTVTLGPEALKKLERKANQRVGKKALETALGKAVEQNDNAQRRLKAAFDMRLDGEIDKSDLERAKQIAAQSEEAVTEARLNLEGYGRMRERLSGAFADIGVEVAKGLRNDATADNALKTHHFMSMLFPDGLCLIPQTDTFRIKSFNQILCGTGLLSVSYEGIEKWPPTEMIGDHATESEWGGTPGVIRTLADHKMLLDSYLIEYG